ncbi:hypothetical protein LTR95_004004 [Oleoguttula sp. CCFEE 5521]
MWTFVAAALLGATLAAAQNVNNGTSMIEIVAPHATAGISWAGSVVDACSGTTTVALQCTAAESSYLPGVADYCPRSGATPTLVVTVGPSLYAYATTTSTAGVTVNLNYMCSLGGTTSAVCTETLSGSANGKQTQTATSTTYASADIVVWQAAVTAGAEKLGATAACASAPANAGARLAVSLGALGVMSFAAILLL